MFKGLIFSTIKLPYAYIKENGILATLSLHVCKCKYIVAMLENKN